MILSGGAYGLNMVILLTCGALRNLRAELVRFVPSGWKAKKAKRETTLLSHISFRSVGNHKRAT
jgi:hypothetical protein